MKSILSIFFALLISCGQKTGLSGYITFEKVGNSDKPFTTIIISTYDLPKKSFTKIIVVDQEIFDSIRIFVEDHKDIYNEDVIDVWSTFKVSAYINNLTEYYLIHSRENSIDYFKKLKHHLDKMKHEKAVQDIQIELDLFLKRLGT